MQHVAFHVRVPAGAGKTVEDDRYKFAEYVSDEAKEYLTARYGYKEFAQKPATAIGTT